MTLFDNLPQIGGRRTSFPVTVTRTRPQIDRRAEAAAEPMGRSGARAGCRRVSRSREASPSLVELVNLGVGRFRSSAKFGSLPIGEAWLPTGI